MRRLLELDVLQERTTDTLQPSFRWGARAPAEVLNLAYAQAPGLTSQAALLVLDRSGSFGIYATPVNITEKTMFVTTTTQEGATYYVLGEAQNSGTISAVALPSKDWYVTNAFIPVARGGVEAYVPLYFLATSRFLHYEVNPPTLGSSEAARYGAFGNLQVYQGRQIQLWEHGEPSGVPHVIALRAVAGYSELWFVDVYFPYLADIFERRLVLSYYKARVKTSGSGYDRYPQHYETLSPRPYFREHVPRDAQGQPVDQWDVGLSPTDTRFVVHADSTGNGFLIQVGEPVTQSQA